MPIYKKKPVEIEARPWDGTAEGAVPIINWILENGPRAARYHDALPEVLLDDGRVLYPAYPASIMIDTLEGTMRTVEGDWVIMGVQNEFYPCKPGIFADTYEYVRE